MSGKRLDPQEQHDVAPSARERPADKTTDTARTENRMSHTHDRKRRSREPPSDASRSVVAGPVLPLPVDEVRTGAVWALAVQDAAMPLRLPQNATLSVVVGRFHREGC
jgi:hypothetical protein